jgi:hypothetical protein
MSQPLSFITEPGITAGIKVSRTQGDTAAGCHGSGAFVILRTKDVPCLAIEYSRSLALQEQPCLVQLKEQLQLLFDSESVNT